MTSRSSTAAFVAAALTVGFCGGHSFTAFVASPSSRGPSSHPEAPLGLRQARDAPADDAPPAAPPTGLLLVGASAALLLLTGTSPRAGAGRRQAAAAAPRGPAPLRAFENETGVQDPMGFWDPAGFTFDGSVENFARRRQTELKHGRVSMLATMGYITPEVSGKFPGYLSPSSELKFADIPNGLGAISKVPAAGWAQIVAYAAFCELSQNQSAGTPAAKGDFGWKVLTASDPTERQKKLAAEIANGRLAMVAIIGMFFQDGLTGSAWGDWALYTDSPLRAFESELGAMAPFGFWDPAGMCADGDVESFKRRRATELKHGRLAMFACLGYIVPEFYKWPGYCSESKGLLFQDIPNGLAAVSKVPGAGWVQVFLFCGTVEKAVLVHDPTRAPGDFANGGVLGVPNGSAMPAGEGRNRKLTSEIANGRLAMMAIIGMFFQDGLTGSAWGDWALYTDSPLRAFENETGVQDPMGFWDPAGFTFDGSVENFARRRQTELKHGRVSMLATMGYITPEVSGKFPGYLSPSAGIKFADVPNGLGAISKVPAAGWAQIAAYAAFCELSQNQAPGTPGAAGDFGWKVLTASDPVEKQKKLAAEIANGRLAMMAIIGMFFQDGLTGSAWGDWALYTGSPLRAFESELGVQAPVGFWDPAGLSKDGDAAAFKRRRSTEIKHGRVSMLATMGYITPEVAGKFPGYLSPSKGLAFEDIPNGLAAISKVPFLGWLQIVIYCLYVEASGLGFNYIGTEQTPGDVGWKPPLLSGFDGEAKTKKLNAEIANGRLAMVAIIGMFFQDGLTGSAWGDWALYTDSPLRAFESELGVQAPLGFWDPLGLSADGDVKSFKRRRSVEIKHGRICMMATMGYITPEVAGKWPGYISKSEGLKFADIPNGLAAISKVPGLGWLQIASWFAFCEIQQGYDADAKTEPGNVGWKPPLLVSADPETRKRRLNAEIANGRLAMMAIIGMFFQDGLTGSAWGDWALYTDSPLRAFENELGVQPPTGFWDPAGFTKDGDADAFKRRRCVEIRHGRICMLATMGYITPEITGKFPGYLSLDEKILFEDVPNGLAALSKIPVGGYLQILAYCGYCEFSGTGVKDGIFYAGSSGALKDGEAEPGNVGWKPPLLTSADPEVRKRRLNAEIANGRLAMMATIGMFFQDGLTGSAWGDWANYTDSPLRAFENELGVQPPAGFWDPAGFTADGSAEDFARRRATEIKHGRIAMLAAMGYITPELIGPFPGYLSPQAGLKFADVPNGLGALSKVPLGGWGQIFLYCAYVEISQDQTVPGSPASRGEFGFTLLSSPDPAEKQKKLAAEIANGRLAMMAIIGMFFQDGLTGSAWGDWALYTGSPLRAFESEIGVQAPVGFWDPMGLSSDGDVATFKRRRTTELKHGRVSMWAAMGYIAPEYFKWPGYLSPSAGLKFADVPNGLAALSKVPLSGWLQIVLFAGYWEFGTYNSTAPPGDLGWKAITSSDPEVLKRKLNAEMANGRLAMMAIMGMLYQDGLTGSAWGDWDLYTDSPLR